MWRRFFLLGIFVFFALTAAFCQEADFSKNESEFTESNETFDTAEFQNNTESSKKRPENFVGKTILSFDLGYMGMGLRNQGWGLGVNYEIELFRFFALKPGFSHMTLYPRKQDFVVTTVGIKLDALCYPFARGLDWLYFGIGSGCDFLMYSGDGISDDNNRDSVLSAFPQIGWKQTFFNYVMTDIYCGYRFIQNPGDINDFAQDYVKKGFEYGVRFKLNLSEIFKLVFKNKTAVKKEVQNAERV